MPASPLWIHRLPDALPVLASLPQDLVDRRTLEELLGVGKWTAWRIMRQCGATDGPGGALVCRRDDLLARLGAIQQDGRFAPELARRQRLETYLDGMLQFASSKHKEIARHAAAEALVSSRFASLPSGVDLQPGELRIQFRGMEDFLRKVGAVVFALQNDLEAVGEFVEAGSAPGAPKEG
jgi:hypothetical protein